MRDAVRSSEPRIPDRRGDEDSSPLGRYVTDLDAASGYFFASLLIIIVTVTVRGHAKLLGRYAKELGLPDLQDVLSKLV